MRIASWDTGPPEGYAYLAVEKGTLRVVEGDEPDEEVRVLAQSVPEMLERMARPGVSGVRWS